MTASEVTASLVTWGPRALYVGPAVELSSHRSAVAVFAIGVDAPFRLEIEPATERSTETWCRSALIPADTLHRIAFEHGAEACLYLDPQSSDVAVLISSMRRRVGQAFADHDKEVAILELMAEAAAQPDRKALRLELADLLGLTSRKPVDARVGRAINAMHAAPEARHSLDDLAACACLSPSRFLHLFKKELGVPLRRYRIWARIGAALRAVGRGETLTDAAHCAGFASSAHFSSAFRSMFGLPPSSIAPAAQLALKVAEQKPRFPTGQASTRYDANP